MKKLAIVLLVFLALPLAAQRARTENFASDFQTVPVLANVTGVGGVVFHSYVALLNPTSSAFPVEVTLYDNAGTARNATITLAAGEVRTYENFLDAVFHYSGGGAATFRAPNANNRFILGTEVRTTPGGFSTMIPVLEFAGSTSRSFSAGITVDTNSRTNIGCFNQSGAANRIVATVFDRTGHTAIGSINLDLAGNAWGQTAVNQIVSDGFVRFEPLEPAVCYAVVVHNSTNDGRFVQATEYAP